MREITDTTLPDGSYLLRTFDPEAPDGEQVTYKVVFLLAGSNVFKIPESTHTTCHSMKLKRRLGDESGTTSVVQAKTTGCLSRVLTPF